MTYGMRDWSVSDKKRSRSEVQKKETFSVARAHTHTRIHKASFYNDLNWFHRFNNRFFFWFHFSVFIYLVVWHTQVRVKANKITYSSYRMFIVEFTIFCLMLRIRYVYFIFFFLLLLSVFGLIPFSLSRFIAQQHIIWDVNFIHISFCIKSQNDG